MKILLDDLTGPEIARLLEEHYRNLRTGVASALLRYILGEARRRKYQRLSLETGAQAAFEPARRLYAGFGFERCGPFGDYVEDPNSVFMTKAL